MLDRQKRKIWEKYTKVLLKLTKNKSLYGHYAEDFIKKMRTTYYKGIPASILLLLPDYYEGVCEERSILMAAVLKDYKFRIVRGNILGIRFNSETMEDAHRKTDPNYTQHYWVEFKCRDSWYVVGNGIIMWKTLYYLIHMPKKVEKVSKETTFSNPDFLNILHSDIEKNKEESLLSIPEIEKHLDNSFYKDQVLKELAYLKEVVHYEELVQKDYEEQEESPSMNLLNKNTIKH